MAWNFLAMTVSGAEARSAKLRNAAAGLAQDHWFSTPRGYGMTDGP